MKKAGKGLYPLGSILAGAALFVCYLGQKMPLRLRGLYFQGKWANVPAFLAQQFLPFGICLAVSAALGLLLWFCSERVEAYWLIRILKRTCRVSLKSLLRAGFFAALLAEVILTGRSVWQTKALIRDIKGVSDAVIAEQIVSHSGGSLTDEAGNEQYYVGSFASLDHSVAHDLHYIEMDMARTTDKALVCLHSWKYLVYPDGTRATKRMSLEEFLSGKIHGIYAPMTFLDLVDYMQAHPDLYIITDIKKNDFKFALSYIVGHVPPSMLDRFIVQIYHEGDYEKARSAGFKYMIYTLYKTKEKNRTPEKLLDFVREHPLVSITISVKFSQDPDYFAALAALPVPIFVYTIDEPSVANDYLSRGASAIYSNNLDIRKDLS